MYVALISEFFVQIDNPQAYMKFAHILMNMVLGIKCVMKYTILKYLYL